MEDSQDTETTEIVFRHNAVDVPFDRATEMSSLTALWHAKGDPAHQQPAQWLRLLQARELLAALESEGIVGDALLRTREGARGGTWAHWQVATAYAHYLDPHFYLAWNRWARKHMGLTPSDATLDSVAGQLRDLQTTLAQLRAQQVQQIRVRALPGPRPLAPEAQAILTILRASPVALSPAHVARLLEADGIVRSGRYVRVRLMRLAERGLAVHMGRGLYQAIGTDD